MSGWSLPRHPDGDRPDVDRPLSALPSPAARVLAFVAILVGGFAGGLIGYTLVELQCHGDCDVAPSASVR